MSRAPILEQYLSIDTNFDPPYFSLDNTFKWYVVLLFLCLRILSNHGPLAVLGILGCEHIVGNELMVSTGDEEKKNYKLKVVSQFLSNLSSDLAKHVTG